MNFTNLLILRGIPASGKSTFATELVKIGYKRVNRDSLREMVDSSVWSKSNEKFIIQIRDHIVKSSLESLQSVVVDDTNLDENTVKHLHNIAQEVALNGTGVRVSEKWFDVDLDTALARNAGRTGTARVPDDVIRRMYKQCKSNPKLDLSVEYPAVAQIAKLEQDPLLTHAIIVDLDGTVAIANGRNIYDASRCDEDLPNKPIVDIVERYVSGGTTWDYVLFCSGRENKFREQTMTFLRREFDLDAMYWKLFMRPTGDKRKDYIVKEEIFKNEIYGKYYVDFCLDDRDQVVAQWRRMGLTCLQVAPGDF